jgi:putative FmdB family regulatory protein
MPLYEYQCDACAHRFEVIQKFSDAPIGVCPKCGGMVAKLPSSPAIQFKGSGWYITDYARAGKSESTGATPAKPESATAAPADTATPTTAKADAKADPKPQNKPSASSTPD